MLECISFLAFLGDSGKQNAVEPNCCKQARILPPQVFLQQPLSLTFYREWIQVVEICFTAWLEETIFINVGGLQKLRLLF
jgi:hypothetical protein